MSTSEIEGILPNDSPTLEYIRHPNGEPLEIYEQLIECVDSGIFHSAKDREIAAQIADNLLDTVLKNPEKKDRFVIAANSLASLVPVLNDKGLREICGKVITPTLESHIASRLDSPETDIMSVTGSWGRLPEKVRHELIAERALNIEMTNGCTVGCGFCVFAQEKGAIRKKISFDSILTLVREGGQSIETLLLYDGSDPFDAKWHDSEGGELDYADLVDAIDPVLQNQWVQLHTSTAVPVGEELRILNFVLNQPNLRGWQRGLNHFVRLSSTPGNIRRIEQILNIVNFVRPQLTSQRFHASRIDDDIAKRGKSLEKATEWSAWDISGPDCIDGAIIGADSIHTRYLLGASTTNPLASVRQPLETHIDPDSGREGRMFRWPKYHNSAPPHQKPFGMLYPPIFERIYTEIYDQDGTVVETIFEPCVAYENPHRHLGRLAAAHDLFDRCKQYSITYRDDVRYFMENVPPIESLLAATNDPLVEWLLNKPFRTEPPKSAREFYAEHPGERVQLT